MNPWHDLMKSTLQVNKKLMKDTRDLKIKQLSEEILRKDKVLAEISALMILPKKVHFFWKEGRTQEKQKQNQEIERRF